MEAIGAASAIIGVAQVGLELSRVLITIIGDYRDAAKNINRLRDEIHLASICLQQLGDLARQDVLREYGILEATNLRERCQAVFWEIRSKIRRSDSTLHPTKITKEEIDVTYFTSLRWALWTKKQLEEPRQELDRLKDSMTLCFVSHMAILATTDLERNRYASQIPGIKRSLLWSEKVPDDDFFRQKLINAGIPLEKVDEILSDDVKPAKPVNPQSGFMQAPSPTAPSPTLGALLKAWTLDPLAKTHEFPASEEWITRFLRGNDQGDAAVWKIHSKLHPWFKDEISDIFRGLETDRVHKWALVFITPTYGHLFARGQPKSVQIVAKASPRETVMALSARIQAADPVLATQEVIGSITYDPAEPNTRTYIMQASQPNHFDANTAGESRIVFTDAGSEEAAETESDEEIIARQLALYQ